MNMKRLLYSRSERYVEVWRAYERFFFFISSAEASSAEGQI